MFKRIHSKRDPGDTLGSELKKEFAVYLDKAGGLTRRCLERNPKFTLIGMSICILISLVLSFTLFRKPTNSTQSFAEQHKVVAGKPAATMGDGLDQILSTTSALQETMQIKKQVEQLLAKPTLTAADSAELENALNRLGQLQNHLNQKP